jgi:hypothetical protein
MTLFEALFVTHFVADWIFQSQWQANNKSKDLWALIRHCGIYTLLFIPVLFLFKALVAGDGLFQGWILLTLFFSHAILDSRKFEFWIMKLKGIHLAKNQVGAKPSYCLPLRPYSFDRMNGQQPMDLGLWWIIMIGIDQTFHILVLGIIAFLLR